MYRKELKEIERRIEESKTCPMSIEQSRYSNQTKKIEEEMYHCVSNGKEKKKKKKKIINKHPRQSLKFDSAAQS